MSNELILTAERVVKPAGSFRELLDFIEAADTIYGSMPNKNHRDRFKAIFINQVRKQPDILQCSLKSIGDAIANACDLGLDIDGLLGHAYIIPFGKKGQLAKDAVLVAGYKGLIDICRRSGNVSTVVSESVFESDEFEYALGTDPYIKHVPDMTIDRVSDKDIKFVYAVFKLRDGASQFTVWTRDKIDSHKRKYSKGWKRPDSPWQYGNAWEKMAHKTVMRDLIQSGKIPVSAEAQKLVSQEVAIEYDSFRESENSKPKLSIEEISKQILGESAVDPVQMLEEQEQLKVYDDSEDQ